MNGEQRRAKERIARQLGVFCVRGEQFFFLRNRACSGESGYVLRSFIFVFVAESASVLSQCLTPYKKNRIQVSVQHILK